MPFLQEGHDKKQDACQEAPVCKRKGQPVCNGPVIAQAHPLGGAPGKILGGFQNVLIDKAVFVLAEQAGHLHILGLLLHPLQVGSVACQVLSLGKEQPLVAGGIPFLGENLHNFLRCFVLIIRKHLAVVPGIGEKGAEVSPALLVEKQTQTHQGNGQNG